MKSLSEIQTKILSILEENMDNPLTFREIQDLIGASSVNLVQHHIKQLEKKGHLKRNPSNPRDYTIFDSKIAYINVYGEASCGPSGSVLDGEPELRVPISVGLLNTPPGETFFVRAIGDSMKPRIYPGDMVIARMTNYANDGDVVVCVNNGFTIIKQLRKTEKGWLLVSFNGQYEPFEPSEDFYVYGKVEGILTYNI